MTEVGSRPLWSGVWCGARAPWPRGPRAPRGKSNHVVGDRAPTLSEVRCAPGPAVPVIPLGLARLAPARCPLPGDVVEVAADPRSGRFRVGSDRRVAKGRPDNLSPLKGAPWPQARGGASRLVGAAERENDVEMITRAK